MAQKAHALGSPIAQFARQSADHKRQLKRPSSSAVAQVKELYRRSSKIQRQMLRAWFRRVLNGEDGKP